MTLDPRVATTTPISDNAKYPGGLTIAYFLLTLPRRIKNRLLNGLFSTLYGHRLNLDWADVKIIGGFRRIHLGRHFFAGRGLWLETIQDHSLIIIGQNVNVSDWVHIGSLNRVEIGDGCLLGSKVLVSDHGHGSVPDVFEPHVVRPNLRPLHSKGPVSIGKNVWIGDSAAVLSGVTIGANAIIGANSVVIRDVPPGTVWAGAPATQIWPRLTK